MIEDMKNIAKLALCYSPKCLRSAVAKKAQRQEMD